MWSDQLTPSVGRLKTDVGNSNNFTRQLNNVK
jgi:hypothetical protein